MNELINKLVDDKLTMIFADYPTTEDLNDLKREISSDMAASAEDKLTDETNEQEAVNLAFAEFGDIDDLISQVLNESESDENNHYHKTLHEHRIDIDNDGMRVDNGKVLNINEDGLTVNGGKTVRIDSNGVKLGNMIINEDGINFNGQPKSTVDSFNARFNAANFETEMHVESLPLADKKEFVMDEIKSLNISFVSASLKIVATTGNKIIIQEYMSRTNPDYQVKTNLNDDTLTIIQGQVPHFLPLKVKVRILVPINFEGDLTVLNHSGNLQLHDLDNLQKTSIKVNSGLIYLNNIETKELLISSNSGKITLDGLNARKNLLVKAKSSVISLNSVYSPDYDFLANSGTIKSIDLSGAGKISAKSGTIKVDFKQVTGDIVVENNSGTVKLLMPSHDSYNFDLEAKSGTVKMNNKASFKHDILSLKEGIVGQNPQYKLMVRAKSGTIRVN